IQRHDGATMSLTNGCVCCSIGSGFFDTLGKVLDCDDRFERIVIEASGVGDPWRIAEIALVEPELRLDGVIVLADATRIAGLIDDRRVGDTVRSQFAKSDLVLLSKGDLASEEDLDRARNAVRSLRADVRIEVLSPDKWFDPCTAQGKHSRFQAVDADAASSDHEESFRRWTYRRDGAFDRGRLAAAMATLPPQLLRLKGACRVAGEGAPLVLQMVSKDWSLSNADGEIDPRGIALVGIGTADLPGDGDLDAILDTALA
ncbi:CobW family GTP-binding protein, partial [Bradyrhizobium sp.]|uniref:CobW family GTP-binding protein n=1 Tax=Bradyrhizobium sp. TaxID=376 RepID=UPI003C585F4A